MIPSFLESASTFSHDIDHAIWTITLVVGFWFFLAEALLFFAIFKFRAKKGRRPAWMPGEGKQLRWILVPLALVVMCDLYLIAADAGVWVKVKQTLPEADAVVRVTAQQWSWTFQHPGPDGKLDTDDDVTTINELHVEVGRTYHVLLESTDVLHSFSVPVFRLKQDIVPGRTITAWFQATLPGEHDLQCVEMCGIGHGLMAARIFIEGPADHLAWLDRNATNAAVAAAR